MRDTERRRYEMLARVRDFGAAHAASFPPASRGAELFAALDGVVAELDAQAGEQVSGASAAVQGTSSRAATREALREDLEAISRTARAMAFDTPGLEDRFRLPRGNRNDQILLGTARAFLSDAEPLKSEFIRHEMPADFLQDLQADIEAFDASVAHQNRSEDARVAATGAIDSAIDRGGVIVRQLDAIVRNKFRNDPAMLSAWTSAAHTQRPPRTRISAPTPPAPQP